MNLLLRPRFVLFVFSVSACLALGLAAWLPLGHDYADYVKQWRHAVAGDDPWDYSVAWPINAYGPAHAFIGPGVLVADSFNRVLFVVGWLGLSFWSFRRLRSGSSPGDALTPGVAAWGLVWLAGPFFWVFTVAFGTNDILVALSCVLALAWTQDRRPVAAGVVLAAGFLYKFIPILILPFLLLSPGFLRQWRGAPLVWLRAVQWRVPGAFVLVAGCGLGLAWVLWGDAVWRPFLLGTERPSSTLSLFRFLRGQASPLRWAGVVSPNLDAVNLPVMFLAYAGVALAFALGFLRRAAAVTTALLAVFVFYRVGHHQFYAPIFFLVPLAVAFDGMQGRRARSFQAFAAVILGWMTVAVLLYIPFRYRNESFQWLDEWWGLPTFVAGVVALIGMLRAAWRSPPEAPDE